jgi:hypothetical protein
MPYLHPDWQAIVRVRTAVVIKMAVVKMDEIVNNYNIKIIIIILKYYIYIYRIK